MTKKRPATIKEYIEAAPLEARSHLRQLYRILKSVAPEGTEAIKWGGPGVLGAPNSVRLCGVQGAHQLRPRAGRHKAFFQGACAVQDREGHDTDSLRPISPRRPRSQDRFILHHRCAGE